MGIATFPLTAGRPAAVTLSADREVALVGFLSSPTGLGAGARRHAQALATAGYQVLKYNLPLRHRGFEIPVEDAMTGVPHSARTVFHMNPPEMLINVAAMRQVQARSHVIGYWAWELPAMPAEWAPALDLVDEIWVPAQFVADAYRDATRKPVTVVPHPVPLNDIPQHAARARFGIPHDRYAFLTAFDSESHPLRKNPEGAVRAFRDAFPHFGPSSPLMVVKVHGRWHRSPELEQLLAEIGTNPAFRVIDETLDEHAMTELQAACDCFVSLHRSEGFGLNIAECMGAGRLAIATDFSGNLDFMSAQNSLLIPYAMRALKRGDYITGTGQWWAEPDHTAAVEAMRWAVGHRSEADALAHRARKDIARSYSFEHVGAMATAALSQSARKRALPSFPREPQSSSPSIAPGWPKVGRNDPCPCGSGRKYKACHGGPR
ncbi:MAG TPA: SEC-C metal-binding domain-containing protein [Bauldia sp.]|nr:SEC-C metal-binding domain-containing protein [Bauldia sp.]